MKLRAVSGIMLTLLLIAILFTSVFPSVSLVQQTGNPRYFATYSGQSTLAGGLVTTNTTWTLEASPYIVIEDVVVESDVFLTIQPGVVVQFCEGTNLVINGGLIAQGNSTHKITFTSNSTTPAKGDWGSIDFRGTTSIALLITDYLQIAYATTGINLGSTFYVANISNSLIANCSGTGISGVTGTVYNVTVENCWRGIDPLFMHGYGLRCERTRVINNSYHGLVNLKNATIIDSEVSHNGGLGIYSYGGLNLVNCTVRSNRRLDPNLRGFGICAQGSVEVVNCTISDNEGDGITGGSPLRVTRSKIVNNGYAAQPGESVAGILTTTFLGAQLLYNTIYNNTFYDLSLGAISGQDFDATLNWWGTTNETLIEEHIYDYYDDYNRGKVLYRPYLMAPFESYPVASFFYEPSEPVVNETVTFNASTSYDSDGSVVSYAWDFGDGNITTIPDPTITHTYTSYGVFIVNLTVTDNDGLVDSEIKSITVRQYPTANFIHYPSIPEMGGNVLFDASASTPNGGTILSYTWDFGDGNVTDTSSPTILPVYFDYGNFTVTLQIQDDEGLTDSETKIIHVHAEPVVDFTYTPASPLVDEIVTFNASDSFDFDGYLVTYVWDFGDGTNATETDPIAQHSYSQAGIYTVALSAIDNDSLITTIMKDLNVGKIPASVSISTSSPSTYVGFSVNITGTLHDLYSNGLSDETVVLYYTVSGVGTWTPITSDATDNLGRYSAMWIPPATGYFEIKAEWAGNATHLGATNTTTLSSVVYNNQYVFSVESNSTISELAFNTENWKLSFTATGPDGTTGYVKVTVAKSLIADIADIRVYLDGKQSNFSITSTDGSWLLTFTYEHSVHEIVMDLDINIIPEFPTWTLMLLILIMLIAASAIYKRIPLKI